MAVDCTLESRGQIIIINKVFEFFSQDDFTDSSNPKRGLAITAKSRKFSRSQSLIADQQKSQSYNYDLFSDSLSVYSSLYTFMFIFVTLKMNESRPVPKPVTVVIVTILLLTIFILFSNGLSVPSIFRLCFLAKLCCIRSGQL